MYEYSGHEARRLAASPHEQLEPPFYLLPSEGKLFAAIRHACRRIADKLRGDRGAAESSDLDDYQLFDIGICRDEMRTIDRRASVDSRRKI